MFVLLLTEIHVRKEWNPDHMWVYTVANVRKMGYYAYMGWGGNSKIQLLSVADVHSGAQIQPLNACSLIFMSNSRKNNM